MRIKLRVLYLRTIFMEKICQKKRIRNKFHTLKKTANIFKKLLGKEIHFERSSNTLKKSNFIFLFEPSVPSVEIIRKNKRPGTSYQSIHRLPNLFLKTCVCVSGSKKCSFFGKFGVICFLVTLVLRFTLLPYYRRLKAT